MDEGCVRGGGGVPMKPLPKGGASRDNAQAVIEPATGSTGVGAGGENSNEENDTTAST